MHHLTRRNVLAVFSVPVAATTATHGLFGLAVNAKSSDPTSFATTDWRGLPQQDWREDKLSHGERRPEKETSL